MQGEQIADLIEKLIDAKIAKQTKVAAGNWTGVDESMNRNFISKAKADLAKLFPKRVLGLKDDPTQEQ
jgi:hypothetical protein